MYKLTPRLALVICILAMSFSHAQTAPSSTVAETAASAMGVQVLSSSQMQKDDADLLAARRADVARAAELYGYDVSSGTWTESQVLCHAVPNHLLMHYRKLSPDGALSLFTAVIPRDNGRVRMVPVLYHGTQAFRVFGSTPGQRELINQVVPAVPIAANPVPDSNWSSLAYCYAALAGAEPASFSLTWPEQALPMLTLSPEGKVREVSFSLVGPDRLIQDWKVLFDRKSRVDLIALSFRPVHPLGSVPEAELKSRPVPASQ